MSGYTTKGIRVLLLIVLLSPCFSVLRCYADNSPAIGVEIVRVVDIYYADSTSWVPYKFMITGASGNATITAGMVELYLNDTKKFECDISIAAGSNEYFIFKPMNSQSAEYIAVIDEALFDESSMSTGSEEVSAYLRLKGVSGIVDGKAFGPIDSKKSDDFLFIDNTVEIVEMNNSFDLVDITEEVTRQMDINEASIKRYMIIDHPFWPMQGGYTYPFDPYVAGYTVGSFDFDDWQAREDPIPGGSEQDVRLSCRLWDDYDFDSLNSNHTVDARRLDKQVSIYFLVYYPRISDEDPNNPFGKPVVGAINGNNENTAQVVFLYGLDSDYGHNCSGGNEGGFGNFSSMLGLATYVVPAATPYGAALATINSIWGAINNVMDLMGSDEGEYKTEIGFEYAMVRNNIEETTERVKVLNVSGGDIIDDATDKWFTKEKTFSVNTYIRLVMTASVAVRSTSREHMPTTVEANLDLVFDKTYAQMFWNEISPSPRIWVEVNQ